MSFNLAALLKPVETYLGTTTAKVLPLVTGAVGTILAADPNQVSAALTPFLPALGPGATSIVGAAMTGLSVVHALVTKSPATPAHSQPQSPPAALAQELVNEASSAQVEPNTATAATVAAAVTALLGAKASPTPATVPASVGTSSTLKPIVTSVLKENTMTNPNQVNMPQMQTATATQVGGWVSQAEVIATDIQNSMPIINEVLAMIQALTGKTIPGIGAGEAVAAVILSDVQGFGAGKLVSSPTTTVTIGGVKVALTLSAQQVS